MTALKRITAFVLSLCLLLAMTACGANDKAAETPSGVAPESTQSPSPPVNEPGAADENVPDYIGTELVMPDWISELDCFDPIETLGDTLFMNVSTVDGTQAIAGYDTLSGTWQRYDPDTGNGIAASVSIHLFSAADGALWILLRETSPSLAENDHDLSKLLESYYLLYIDLDTGERRVNHLDIWQGAKTPFLMSLIALDKDRALLGDGENAWLIDPDAQLIGSGETKVRGMGFHVRINGVLYVDTADGLSRLDMDTLQYVEPLEELIDQFLYGSSLGRVLADKDGILYGVDPSTGEKTELFSWADISASPGQSGFENANGDIFILSDRLFKVSPT